MWQKIKNWYYGIRVVPENGILIEITEEDNRKKSGYTSVRNCLLATALKRIYPNKFVSVGGSSFNIGDDEYRLSRKDRRRIQNSYHSIFKFKPFTVIGVKE